MLTIDIIYCSVRHTILLYTSYTVDLVCFIFIISPMIWCAKQDQQNIIFCHKCEQNAALVRVMKS